MNTTRVKLKDDTTTIISELAS
uniref:Uncharacterized protein n=1 Tax=Arundo donax TaxID=35708 RepID=A0A0A9HAZ9_ARUDO